MHTFHLDTTLGHGGAAEERQDGVFRILLVGDFSAAGDRTPSLQDVVARRPTRVDLDTAEAVLRAWSPRVRLASIAGQPAETLVLDSFDALTPDGLVERLATVRAVREAMARPADAPPRGGGAVRGGAVLDAILDDAAPPDPLGAMHKAGGDLSAFIAEALKGHEVTAAQRAASARADATEAAIDAVLRAALRDAAFRAAESLWLSVQLMTRRLEAVPRLELWLLDCSPAAIDVVLPAGGDPTASPLAAMLRRAPEAGGWSLLAGAFDVGPSVDDVGRLGDLAALGASLGAPWVVGAVPSVTGFDALADAAASDEWPPSASAWDAFRRTSLAKWVSLVPNGVMVRAPYGVDGEQTSRIFEEVVPKGAVVPYSWMPPAFAVVLAVGLAYGETEGELARAGAYAIDGLPFVVAAGDPVPTGQVLLSERAMAAFAARGLTPLETHKSAGVVRWRGAWSCALPPRRVAGSFWENT